MINRYQLISITFHCMILVLTMIALPSFIPVKKLGETQINAINAYIQAAALPTQKETKSESAEPMLQAEKKIMRNKNKIIKETHKISKATSSNEKLASVQTLQQTQGDHTDELLFLLHQAIQQVQRYPASAEALGREGRTTVSFKLLVNGDVTNVMLQQSSGVTSLDHAALDAVKAAAPFHGIERFLSEPRIFAVDVVFALL